MYPLGPAAHAVPGVICLEVFYDSRKGNCNDDDRRQWRKQGGAVGAAASRMRAVAKQTLGAATRVADVKGWDKRDSRKSNRNG